MISSLSAGIERVSVPIDSYLFGISSGPDTYYAIRGKPEILQVVRTELHTYDRRLRVSINLGQRDFSEVSDHVAGELALLGDIQKRAYNNPIGAAHYYRMASGAERASRNNLGNHNEVIKTERAALEIIYMADAVQSLREAGRPDTAFAWCLEQSESLKEAYGMIEMPGRLRNESLPPRQVSTLLDRASEAYRRGRLLVAGI